MIKFIQPNDFLMPSINKMKPSTMKITRPRSKFSAVVLVSISFLWLPFSAFAEPESGWIKIEGTSISYNIVSTVRGASWVSNWKTDILIQPKARFSAALVKGENCPEQRKRYHRVKVGKPGRQYPGPDWRGRKGDNPTSNPNDFKMCIWKNEITIDGKVVPVR